MGRGKQHLLLRGMGLFFQEGGLETAGTDTPGLGMTSWLMPGMRWGCRAGISSSSPPDDFPQKDGFICSTGLASHPTEDRATEGRATCF